jgi:hypothetical protein
MTRLFRAAVTGLVALMPAVAAGQSTTSTHYNIAAGATLPLSDFGDRNETGYNIILGIGMSQPGSSLGFRAEGMYNEFSFKCNSSFGGNCSGTSRASGITGNIVYDLVHPANAQSNTVFVLGGIGYYSTRDRFAATSLTNLGYNFGGGFKFPLGAFSAYLEARYHTVQNASVTFLPVSFGLVF